MICLGGDVMLQCKIRSLCTDHLDMSESVCPFGIITSLSLDYSPQVALSNISFFSQTSVDYHTSDTEPMSIW